MNLLNVLETLKDIKADYISLRSVDQKNISTSVRNEIFEGITINQDCGLMIEVMMNGQFAYRATNSSDLAEIKKLTLLAKDEALKASEFSLAKFSLEQRPATKGKYVSPYFQGIDSFDPKDHIQYMLDLSKAMNVDSVVINRSVYLQLGEMTTHFVSTNGADIYQKINQMSFGLSATASSDLGNQSRTYGDELSTQKGFEIINREFYLEQAKKIANEAIELLNAPDCPTDLMDLVLAPDQMHLQIHESIGHPLELDRILGDERNYAGWSFVRPKDFGELRYGSELMNVTFDPTVLGQNASYFADDIGNLATREFLIKDGILQRGIGSLESQKRLGLKGVASQRATSWNRAPIDRMGNINLEPGDASFDEIIKSVKKGVFMQTVLSWSIDDYRNKFQFGCQFARLIEDGKLTKVVKNPNYRGITADFWNKLQKVGDESTYVVGGLTNCGKGEPNQIIFVGHASPVCLFKDIEVFGGGQ